MMKILPLFIMILTILSSFSCNEKTESQTSEMSSDFKEDYEEDYIKVQGIILKIVAVEQNETSSKIKNDIYYVYRIDQSEPIIGVEKNSDSRFVEDDLVSVLVNIKNPNLSNIDRRGMIDQELLYQYLKRTDSSYYRMKKKVPFD